MQEGSAVDERAAFAGAFAMGLSAERAPTLVALRDHPRAVNVVWEEGAVRGQAMVWAKASDGRAVKMRGITKIIDRLFRPSFDYKTTYKKARNSASARRRKKAEKKKRAALVGSFDSLKRVAKATPRLRGTARGTTIHTQLCDSVILSRAEFERTHPALMRWTVGVMAWLRQQQLRPVFAEYPVTSWALGITTPVDLVCLDKTSGSVVLVELKTGYDDMFERGTGPMRAPFTPYLRNSVKHAAFLQAWIVTQVLRFEYRLPGVRALVVHVSGDPTNPTIKHWAGPPKLLKADPTDLWLGMTQALTRYRAAADSIQRHK